MALNPGDYVRERYRGVAGPIVCHALLLVAVCLWTVDGYGVMPDPDHYEDACARGSDFASVHDLSHVLDVPAGVVAVQIYGP
eukprot:3177016-Pyramimonas_sp.AAC.1